MSSSHEQPIVFLSNEESLYGLLHGPASVSVDAGVVILVGGPQYRVGSHRQFVELARGLATKGIPVFRFDFTGMGDSSGSFPGFDHLNNDIRLAIDAFIFARPEIQQIVLWGLCDGASAACFYAPQDERVTGLCLANPWVRTEQGEAEAFLKHYYLSRLLSKEFWSKLFSGKLRLSQALRGFILNLKGSLSAKPAMDEIDKLDGQEVPELALPERVFRGLQLFSGKVIFLISGNDLTAAEFMTSIGKDRRRQKLMESEKISMIKMPDADHTFSRREWMQEVVSQTVSWIRML